MTTKLIQGRQVMRPETSPLTSSILDHATVGPDVPGFGWQNNTGLWPSYNCLNTLVSTHLCPDPLAAKPVKSFAFGGWVPAFEFAVYGAVQCSNVGLDEEDMRSELKRVFALNEGKGIEAALKATRFVAQAASGDPTDRLKNVAWDAPVDLTPGTTPSMVVALALLEGYAASVYAGVPTIHMPRAAGTVLEGHGLIVWQGNKAFTKNGSKVAMGGGYDTLDEMLSGILPMYATGEVYVEKSEEVDVNAYVLHGDGLVTETASGNNFTDNSQLALAERMFRVAVDCFTAKATGSIASAGAEGGGGGFGI